MKEKEKEKKRNNVTECRRLSWLGHLMRMKPEMTARQ